jgi:hypothetical protein
MTASIKVASRALYSSCCSWRQESCISFTCWHSDLFSPHTIGNSGHLFLKARDVLPKFSAALHRECTFKCSMGCISWVHHRTVLWLLSVTESVVLPPVTAEPALAQPTKHLPDLPPS